MRNHLPLAAARFPYPLLTDITRVTHHGLTPPRRAPGAPVTPARAVREGVSEISPFDLSGVARLALRRPLAATTAPSGPLGPPSEDQLATLRDEVEKVVKAEVERYWAYSVIITSDADDPFRIGPSAWWHSIGKSQFPHVAPVARYFFAAMLSSAAIERVFSLAKFWVRDERGRLSDGHLDMCVFLAATFSGAFRGEDQREATDEVIYAGNPFASRQIVDDPAAASGATL